MKMNRRLEDIYDNIVALVINDDDYDAKAPELRYIRQQLEKLNEDIDYLIH